MDSEVRGTDPRNNAAAALAKNFTAPRSGRAGRVHPGGGGAGIAPRERRVDHGETGPDCGLLSCCWTDPVPASEADRPGRRCRGASSSPRRVADQHRVGAAQAVQEPAPPSVALADLGHPTVELLQPIRPHRDLP